MSEEWIENIPRQEEDQEEEKDKINQRSSADTHCLVDSPWRGLSLSAGTLGVRPAPVGTETQPSSLHCNNATQPHRAICLFVFKFNIRIEN